MASYLFFKRILLTGTLGLYLTACSLPPLRQAQELIQAQKYRQAQPILEKLYAEQPDNLSVQALLAQVLFFTQGPQAALKLLRPLYQKHPDNLPVRQALKTIETELQRFDTLLQKPSLQALQTYVHAAPNAYLRERAQWLLILELTKLGRRQEAYQVQDALRTETQDPTILQLLDEMEARASPELLEHLLDRYPKSSLRPLWFWQMLEGLEQAKQHDKVKSALVRFKEEVQDEALKAALVQRQAEHYMQKNPVVALNYYRTLLQNYSKYIRARPLIYLVRDKLGKYLSSADHRFLAQVAFEQGMYQTAAKELQAASPTDRETLLRLGFYARKAGLTALARQVLSEVQQRFPRSLEAGLAGVHLAALQRAARAYSAALAQLRQIQAGYRSQPEVMAEALWEESVVYDWLNQPDKQAERCRVLLETLPRSPHAVDALWIVLWHSYLHGRYAEVLDMAEKYQTLYQKHELQSRFLYWKARTWEQLEQSKKAESVYLTLSQGPALDYYTHRARERLRVLRQGGVDHYTPLSYRGYRSEMLQLPGWFAAFRSRLQATTPQSESPEVDWPEAEQLFYLRQWPEFLKIAQHSSQDDWQYLRGRLLTQAGNYYAAITEFRYKAEDNPLYLSVAFPLAWFDTIEREARKYQLNPFLVAGLIWQESQYKPDIQSWVGATGLMQIMPATATQIAKALNLKNYDLKDPETNLRMGTWYLHSSHQTFTGHSLFAVAAYNAGAGAVLRWKKQFAHLPYDAWVESIPYPETRDYVKKVFTAYGVYQSLYGRTE